MFDSYQQRKLIQARARQMGVKVRFLHWMNLGDIAQRLVSQHVSDQSYGITYARLRYGLQRDKFPYEDHGAGKHWRYTARYEDARDWYRQTYPRREED